MQIVALFSTAGALTMVEVETVDSFQLALSDIATSITICVIHHKMLIFVQENRAHATHANSCNSCKLMQLTE